MKRAISNSPSNAQKKAKTATSESRNNQFDPKQHGWNKTARHGWVNKYTAECVDIKPQYRASHQKGASLDIVNNNADDDEADFEVIEEMLHPQTAARLNMLRKQKLDEMLANMKEPGLKVVACVQPTRYGRRICRYGLWVQFKVGNNMNVGSERILVETFHTKTGTNKLEEAGVKIGDELIRVGNVHVADWKMERVMKLLKDIKPEQTNVEMEFVRETIFQYMHRNGLNSKDWFGDNEEDQEDQEDQDDDEEELPATGAKPKP